MKRFQGKTVMVTGAGKNIGKEIAVSFAKEGANVIVCDFNKENAEQTAREIEERNGIAMVAVCDVRDRALVFLYVEKAIERYGKIDILINNAGGSAGLLNKLTRFVDCSHSPTSMAEIINTLSVGDVLTHIYHGGENSCIPNDFEAFKLAKQKGIVMDTGFAGHVHTDFANLKNAINSGFLPDTISTDITCYSAYKRGGRYGMTMCMNIAHKVGMDEEDIFRAVTSSPAKVLGKESEWGYLKEGRCADIAVFDYIDEGFDLTDNVGNRLNSNIGYRCILTVVDGQVVFRD